MSLLARMRARTSTPILGLCASAILVLGASAQESNKDVITLKNGTTESGKIKSEEYGGITFDPGKGGDKFIAWGDLASASPIAYGNAAEYQTAKDLFDQNKLDDALAAFTAMKMEKETNKTKQAIRQNVMYFMPAILQRQGKLDEALTGYKDLLTAFPKSRYLLDVGEGLVAIYVAKKDVAGAAKALDQLSTDAQTAGVETSFNSSMNVLKGKLMEEQKKYAEAAAAYGLAAGASGIPVGVSAKAELGVARCQVALNKKTEAEAAYRKIVAKDAAPGILSGAWNGLGELALERGRAANNGKGDADQILDAEFMFLRGVVQYGPPSAGESTTEYERALAGSATCFHFLAQLDQNADRKRLNNERSAQRAQQLAKEFPNSAFLASIPK